MRMRIGEEEQLLPSMSGYGRVIFVLCHAEHYGAWCISSVQHWYLTARSAMLQYRRVAWMYCVNSGPCRSLH